MEKHAKTLEGLAKVVVILGVVVMCSGVLWGIILFSIAADTNNTIGYGMAFLALFSGLPAMIGALIFSAVVNFFTNWARETVRK